MALAIIFKELLYNNSNLVRLKQSECVE